MVRPSNLHFFIHVFPSTVEKGATTEPDIALGQASTTEPDIALGQASTTEPDIALGQASIIVERYHIFHANLF